MKKLKEILNLFKKPHWLLCLGLGIALVASLFANFVNTSAYGVKVTEVAFKTNRADGELVGLLYRPSSCTKDKPCATIITTHGYLNSKEMQDAPAVEMSRRGYVVLALDMYDHGDSTWDSANAPAGGFSYYSIYDAVQWIYDQDFVLKGTDGTGMIAVSGHSMGAASASYATLLDSQDVAAGNAQKIVAALPVANHTAASANIINANNAQKRTMGTIAARYDEFFFGDDKAPTAAQGGSVYRKDWPSTTAGAKFYFGDNAATASKDIKAAEWNETTYGGAGSVIYVPEEIHPWNHFSVETTSYIIDFYTKAFAKQFEIHSAVMPTNAVTSYKAGTAQTWWLKETFNCIALIGMFIAIAGGMASLVKLPYVCGVKTKEEAVEIAPATGLKGKLLKVLMVISCFSTAYVYPMMAYSTSQSTTKVTTGSGSSAVTYTVTDTIKGITKFQNAVKWLIIASAIVLLVTFVVNFIIKSLDKETEKSTKTLSNVTAGGFAVLFASAFSYWTLTASLLSNSRFYTEPGTNTIAKWALISAGLTLVALAIGYAANNKEAGYTCAHYGLKANWKQVLWALLIAVVVVGGVYAITFAVEALLRVDFRVWTYAIKPFGARSFTMFFRYLPIFFIFYLVNGISIVANTGNDKSYKGTIKAVLMNCLALVILLGVHYGYNFVTGVAKYPTQSLTMIYVFALIPTLGVAAWIARKSYFKTGNVWTGVFINALLFTLVQVANTYLPFYG